MRARARGRNGLLAVFLLAAAGFVQPSAADQNDSRLPDLFAALQGADGAYEAQIFETQIWQIWLEVQHPEAAAALSRGITAMSGGELDSAISHFDDAIQHEPNFAEAWNKRATAYYLAGKMGKSMQDIERTLALEPRHFGAISGMGLIFLQREDDQAALQAFDLVLAIHPFAPGAISYREAIRRRLAGQSS